jgi:cytochrome c oxidase subunit II
MTNTNQLKLLLSGLISLIMLAFVNISSAASEYTEPFEYLMLIETLISVFIILLVMGLITYMIMKFKDNGETTKVEKPKIKNELIFEIGWTLFALIIVIIIFVASMGPSIAYMNPQVDEVEEQINVMAYSFHWTFEFENSSRFVTAPSLNDASHPSDGRNYTVDYNPLVINNPNTGAAYNALVLKTGVTYLLNITAVSNGVIHSFYVHNLHVKADAVPGSSNFLYLKILEPGDYWGTCAELCGAAHYNMLFVIRAV